MRILIMGLPKSGKTALGEKLSKEFGILFWDADVVRKVYNDWDFTLQGRERQALRMRKLSELEAITISAFVCPLPGFRSFFFPDKLIWMDTVEDCEYEDTNKLFSPPTKYDVRITKLGEDAEAFDLVKKCMI